MDYRHNAIGQHKKWSLAEKIGEGDAGEVFRVESLLESKPAILKRPSRSPLPSDILRQASQIRTEGQLLKALGGIAFSEREIHAATPALLDQSPPDERVGEGFFIVIQQAAGFDLRSLLRLIHSGQIDELHFQPSEENRFFLQTISGMAEIPEPILIRSLYNAINFLETIHNSEVVNEGVTQSGIIWNDIKPEHLYWDPIRAGLTIIDWGNGKFLEADGATKDRQHSSMDDYYQFMQEMGVFLAESNADLYGRLEWPHDVNPVNAYSDGITPLKHRLAPLYEKVLSQSKDLRNSETSLYETSRPGLDHLVECENLHRRIVAQGEMPDFSSALNFHARVALQMAAGAGLNEFQQVCQRTARLSTTSTEKWELLAEIAGIALQPSPDPAEISEASFSGLLSAGIADDWPKLLWDLLEIIGDKPLPNWWEDVSRAARRIYLKLDENALTPDLAAKRLFYTLQSDLLQTEDNQRNNQASGAHPSTDELSRREAVLKIFEEEIVKKWAEPDPAPPNSGIGYGGIESILADIETILPGAEEKLESVLSQPKAQAEIALSAWDQKDFTTARNALRTQLIWDPYRRRLIRADKAIAKATEWLTHLRQGAGNDEPFYDYLTSVELAGRNLRNQVGGAAWLDRMLEALKQLRKGGRPADLIMQHPQISADLPWLNEYRSRERLSLPRSRTLSLDRDEIMTRQGKTLSGMDEGELGTDKDLQLAEPLDTWAPEAHGSSARVFSGFLRSPSGKGSQFALKIMRPERVEYALPLFKEEAQILSMMRDVPGITPLVECGFMQLEEGLDFPSEVSKAPADYLRGKVIRYGAEEVQNFLISLERQIELGWLPYLALVKRDQRYNLIEYCDAGYTHGWFLPLQESLLLAIQVCDILKIAHDRNIAYRDHKILHYYWDPDSHGVVMIDWNIAKRYTEGFSDAERQFDLVQFGARALHHILTGRPAPGALPLGPNRPEEIENASLSYTVKWTYDDERLPNLVKELLEQVLNQGYTHIRDLQTDLVQVYEQVSSHSQDGIQPDE